MRCPVCGGKLIVKDTRRTDEEVLRRRQCLSCGKMVYTFEAIDEGDGVRKQLSRIHDMELKKNVSKRVDKT